MDRELLKKAKKLLKDQYGDALAKKASDVFCLHATGVQRTMVVRSFGLESFSAAAPEVSRPGVIMEFKEAAIKKPAKEPSAKKIAKILEEAEGEELKIHLQQALRDRKVKTYRESVIQTIQPFNAFLERSIEREFAHGTQSLQQQSYLTRLCWLNQTVQTIANPKSLAEVAADPTITRFDMPRKLEAEINETGKLVFAPQYRQKFSKTGQGIIVAVIDTEVALNLKAFDNRIVHRRNYTKEPWGNPAKHGTAVAGIIGSSDTNFSGMAPGVTIYNYKVLATDRNLNGDDFDGASAIERALEDGALVANCSWGAGVAGDGTGREARACNAAWDLGMTIVKSAGNNGPGNKTLTTPADARGVIVVGATGRDGKKIESYSSRGPLASGEHRPHLVAPGGSPGHGIFSCLTGGGFDDIGHGTSFAAPHVTGLIALLLEKDHSLSPDDQRNLLLKLCTKLNGFGADAQGAGIVSMSSLLEV